MWFRAATAARKGAGATKNPVDTREAAGDEPSLLEIGVKPLYSQAKLEMSFADDIQGVTGKSLRTTAWSARAVYQGLLVMATPGSPPAGESGVGHFSCPAEATRAKSWVLAARVLKRGDVGGSCLDWPGCASFVHVGPPVGYWDLVFR
jgi:hypothetical protein